MYKICLTEKSLARQRELENGFLQYMDTVPFYEIEVTDLCRSLNVPRKTFYRYFGSREDALYALIDHRLMDMNRFIEENMHNGRRTLRQEAINFFSFWKAEQRFLEILVRNFLGVILMERAMQQPNLTVRLSEYAGQNRDSGSRYTVSFLVAGMMSMMFQWHLSGHEKSPEELADITESIFNVPISGMLDYDT